MFHHQLVLLFREVYEIVQKRSSITDRVCLTLRLRQRISTLTLFTALALVGCGGNSDAPVTPRLEFSTLKGQVNLSSVTPTSVSAYAAARFLEQASWGPTPQAIEEVQRLGIEGWLDRQLATPPSVLNAPGFVINHDSNNPSESDLARIWRDRALIDLGISGPDQLRQRVSWAIFNYINIKKCHKIKSVGSVFFVLWAKRRGKNILCSYFGQNN